MSGGNGTSDASAQPPSRSAGRLTSLMSAAPGRLHEPERGVRDVYSSGPKSGAIVVTFLTGSPRECSSSSSGENLIPAPPVEVLCQIQASIDEVTSLPRPVPGPCVYISGAGLLVGCVLRVL